MMETLIDTVGWAGAACLLLAYWLVGSGRVQSVSIRYHAINILGCILMTLNSGYYAAIPSATMNVIWGVIGLFSTISIFVKTRRPKAKQ